MIKTREPKVVILGPAAEHDMACAVLHGDLKPAVLDLSRGVFQPSWEAQSRGWHLVHAKTLLQRLAIRWLWSER